ncbi:hypothetical protein PG999_008308 [Apiospora kogelbergensis]|uniref:Peptidase S8/S53 domain-containing protein n=1 Tax=Apiospora kogelbergensis TaxID=1337665 RepID=A0AAW0QHM0_9PEZI
MPPTITAGAPPSPSTTTTDRDIGPLPEYKTWPPGAVITPVAVEVDKPKKSDDDDKSSVIPCKLWFFSVISAHPRCTQDCGDPTLSHWLLQSDYIKEVPHLSLNDGIPQMAFLSQSKDEKKLEDGRGKYQFSQVGSGAKYYFDESAGEDIPVYIVDSGANIEHPEFANIRQKIEFIQVDEEQNGFNDDSLLPASQRCVYEEMARCGNHGTAMLALIVGNHLGVAKKIKPLLQTFDKPSDKTLAILNLSWYWTAEGYDKANKGKDTFFGFRNRLAALINTLIRNGVFVVTGSGNDGYIFGWPSLFGVPQDKLWPSLNQYRSTWIHIPRLMVVGALNPADGTRWLKSGISAPISTTDDDGQWFPELYAPGSELAFANGDKNKWPLPKAEDAQLSYYKGGMGTSAASAYTAGLAAYFLKMHQLGRLPKDAKGQDPDMSPAGLKRYLINNAWQRAPAGTTYPKRTPGIWNGSPIEVVSRDGFCPWNPRPPAKLRRHSLDRLTGREQEPPTEQCQLPQSNRPTGTGTATTNSPTGTGTKAVDPTSPSTRPSTTSPPKASSTACTKEMSFMCEHPLLPLACLPPRRPRCQEGKCVCLEPIKCTKDTRKDCAPCKAPEEVACTADEKCTCVGPSKTLVTLTRQPMPPPPEPTGPPLTELRTGEVRCNDKFDHADVNGNELKNWVEKRGCDQFSKEMRSGSERQVAKHPRVPGASVDYFIAVSWIKGCETTVDAIDPKHPLAKAGSGVSDEEKKTRSCVRTTWDCWNECKLKILPPPPPSLEVDSARSQYGLLTRCV